MTTPFSNTFNIYEWRRWYFQSDQGETHSLVFKRCMETQCFRLMSHHIHSPTHSSARLRHAPCSWDRFLGIVSLGSRGAVMEADVWLNDMESSDIFDSKATALALVFLLTLIVPATALGNLK